MSSRASTRATCRPNTIASSRRSRRRAPISISPRSIATRIARCSSRSTSRRTPTSRLKARTPPASRASSSRKRRRDLRRSAWTTPCVRAPFSGTIAKRLVHPGEKVSPDSAIVTLVDLRQMVLEAAVPAADIPSVRHRSDRALHRRRFRRARVRRAGAAHQSDDDGRLALDHDLHRGPERGPRAQGRHVRAGRADARCDAAGARGSAARRARGSRRHLCVHAARTARSCARRSRWAPRSKGAAFVEVREGLAAGDRVIVADDRRRQGRRDCESCAANGQRPRREVEVARR